jgi:hypothetical protein
MVSAEREAAEGGGRWLHAVVLPHGLVLGLQNIILIQSWSPRPGTVYLLSFHFTYKSTPHSYAQKYY